MAFSAAGNGSFTVSSSSLRIALPTLNVPDLSGNSPSAVHPYGRQLRLKCDVDAYYKLGNSTVTASISDTPLYANVVEVFDWNLGNHTHIACYCPTSGTLHVDAGQGEPS